jgi:CheY-like chemotaxis protein
MRAGRRSIASGRTKEFPQLQRDTVNECLCRHRDDGDDECVHFRVIAPAIEARSAAHVLLVDDDERQLKLRAAILEVYGYSAHTATDASDALSTAEREHVDIAVVDYNMPLMNGCVLASYLKASDPQLKVILLSAALCIPAYEMRSIDKFVSKTAAVPELLDAIAASLKRDFGHGDESSCTK